MRKMLTTVIFAAFSLTTAAAIAAPTYTFTKVLENGVTKRPDNGQPFNVRFASMDQGAVIFTNGFGPADSIWMWRNGTFTKLVGTTTPVPDDSGGVFQDFDQVPISRAGVVVFGGYDATSDAGRNGLYSVPLAGGAVQRVVDNSQQVPGSGGGTMFWGHDGGVGTDFVTDGSTVVFGASSNGGSTSVNGLFSASVVGVGLAAVATSQLTPCGVGNQYKPAVSDGDITFTGTGGFSYSTGLNVIFGGPITSGNCPYPFIVSSGANPPLPGEPTPQPNAPHLVFGQSYVQAGTVYFLGWDNNNSGPNNQGYFGLYTAPYTTNGNGAPTLTSIANNLSVLPGMTTGQMNGGPYFSVTGGDIYFAASQNGYGAVYHWNNGVIDRVIGDGDTLDGETIATVGLATHVFQDGQIVSSDPVTPYAASDGTVAIRVNFTDFNSALFVLGDSDRIFENGFEP